MGVMEDKSCGNGDTEEKCIDSEGAESFCQPDGACILPESEEVDIPYDASVSSSSFEECSVVSLKQENDESSSSQSENTKQDLNDCNPHLVPTHKMNDEPLNDSKKVYQLQRCSTSDTTTDYLVEKDVIEDEESVQSAKKNWIPSNLHNPLRGLKMIKMKLFFQNKCSKNRSVSESLNVARFDCYSISTAMIELNNVVKMEPMSLTNDCQLSSASTPFRTLSIYRNNIKHLDRVALEVHRREEEEGPSKSNHHRHSIHVVNKEEGARQDDSLQSSLSISPPSPSSSPVTCSRSSSLIMLHTSNQLRPIKLSKSQIPFNTNKLYDSPKLCFKGGESVRKNITHNDIESSTSGSEFTSNTSFSMEDINEQTKFPRSLTSIGSNYSVTSSSKRYKLLEEGQARLCRLKHGTNIVDKVISSSKFFKRWKWETHHLYLNEEDISSKTPTGVLEVSIPYWKMEQVSICYALDCKSKYVIRILLPGNSILIQGSSPYMRDQWYHSILWKKSMQQYRNSRLTIKCPNDYLNQIKSMVNFAMSTPLHGESINQTPIQIMSHLLDQYYRLLDASHYDEKAQELLSSISPLLERCYHISPSICRLFSYVCTSRPRSSFVEELITPFVRRVLKHNVDFTKTPFLKHLAQDCMLSINCNNDGKQRLRNFVQWIHGPSSSCPHPRVLANLSSLCFSGIHGLYENDDCNGESDKKKNHPFSSHPCSQQFDTKNEEQAWKSRHSIDPSIESKLLCFLTILDALSEYEDWKSSFAHLLQPVPFPKPVLTQPTFLRSIWPIIKRITNDPRCEVHQMILGIREDKHGWFHLCAPATSFCIDDGQLWSLMLERLLKCCCKRKRFLKELGGPLLGSCLLLAVREQKVALEALCLILEWHIVQNDDQYEQIVTTLESTSGGKERYVALCNKMLHLKEIQEKGGPTKLTLPNRSTDTDLAKFLSCGSFGNLQCLSLAFTQVTSACAEQLIKLPSLRYLNLWSTHFGDKGLQLLSEHLPNLQVLNLCETRISDEALLCLAGMKSLRKLNLNSTSLTASTYEILKKSLPHLKDCDVRYTEAW